MTFAPESDTARPAKRELCDRAAGDLALALGVCASFTLGQVLRPDRWWIGAALGGGLLGWAAWREWRLGPRRWADVGLRFDNVGPAVRLAAAVGIPLVVFGVARAAFAGVHEPARFVLALVLYPIWGVVQQAFFQGVVHEALRHLGYGWRAIPMTAAVFGLVHYPSAFLMQATAVGGLLFSWMYARHPNALPIGVLHGIFGAMLYYVFRQQDVFGFF